MKNEDIEQQKRVAASVKRLEEETFKRKDGKLIYSTQDMNVGQFLEEYGDGRIVLVDCNINEKTEIVPAKETIFAPNQAKDLLF